MIQLSAHEAAKMLAWIAETRAYYVARIIEDPSVGYYYDAVSALNWMTPCMQVAFERAGEKEHKECAPVVEA